MAARYFYIYILNQLKSRIKSFQSILILTLLFDLDLTSTISINGWFVINDLCCDRVKDVEGLNKHAVSDPDEIAAMVDM